MSLKLQTIFTNRNRTYARVPIALSHFVKPNKLSVLPLNSASNPTNCIFFTSQSHAAVKVNASSPKLYETSQGEFNGSGFNFDAFLSIIEFLSLASSAAVFIYAALSGVIQKGRVLGLLGSKVFAWQCVILVNGVVVGAVIRRRQWRRISGGGFSRGAAPVGVNLLERVEKLEEDLRSSATVIRVLSRQLEKLGIRFRVFKKAVKEPITETAVLAQKNSEATRSLAAQEEILEKELCEIQKILLAMQEQQQKQLELILAIVKAGKLWENNQPPTKEQNVSGTSRPSPEEAPKFDVNQIETLA